MGIGKVLGFAALGVGAVAAAPFTGGGSILGAASLGASLAGAGSLAATGVTGAVTEAILSEEENKKEHDRAMALANVEVNAAETKAKLEQQKILVNNLKTELQSHDLFFRVIIFLTMYAVYLCQRNNKLARDFKSDIKEYIGGLQSDVYPPQVQTEMNEYLSRNISRSDIREAVKKLNIQPSHQLKIRSLVSNLEDYIYLDVFQYDSPKYKIEQGLFE